MVTTQTPVNVKLKFDLIAIEDSVEIVCFSPEKQTLNHLLSKGIPVNGFRMQSGRNPGYGYCLLSQNDLPPELQYLGYPPSDSSTPNQYTLTMIITDGNETVTIPGLFVDEISTLKGVAEIDNPEKNHLVLVKLIEVRVGISKRFPRWLHNTSVPYRQYAVDDYGNFAHNNIGAFSSIRSKWNHHKVYNSYDLGPLSWEIVLTDLMGLQNIETLFDEADLPPYEPKDMEFHGMEFNNLIFDLLDTCCHGMYRLRDSHKYTVKPFSEYVQTNQDLRDKYEKNLQAKPDFFTWERSKKPSSIQVLFYFTDRIESLETWIYSSIYPPPSNEVDKRSVYPIYIQVPNRVHFSDFGNGFSPDDKGPVNEREMAEKIIQLYYDAWEENSQAYDATYFGVIPFTHAGDCDTIIYTEHPVGYQTIVKSVDMSKHVFPKYNHGLERPLRPSIIVGHDTPYSDFSIGIPSSVPALPSYQTTHQGWGIPLSADSSTWYQRLVERIFFADDEQVSLQHARETIFDASHPKMGHSFGGLRTLDSVLINRPGLWQIDMVIRLNLTLSTTGNTNFWVKFDCVNGKNPTGRFPSTPTYPISIANSDVEGITFFRTETYRWNVEIIEPDGGIWAPGWFANIEGPGDLVPTLSTERFEVRRIK